jgi:hypothetical protein
MNNEEYGFERPWATAPADTPTSAAAGVASQGFGRNEEGSGRATMVLHPLPASLSSPFSLSQR